MTEAPEAQGTPARQGLQGYVSHRTFKGMAMPATVQNLVMRDYAGRMGYLFKLSVDEFAFENCYVQFYGMLRRLAGIQGIVMCSLFMLPRNPQTRRWIYDRFLEAGAELHCVFEGVVIADEAGIAKAEDILQISQALERAPTAIDPALMPAIDGVDSFS